MVNHWSSEWLKVELSHNKYRKQASKYIYYMRACGKANILAEVGLTIYITKSGHCWNTLAWFGMVCQNIFRGLTKSAERLPENSSWTSQGHPRIARAKKRCIMTRNQLERMLERSNFNLLFQHPPESKQNYSLRNKSRTHCSLYSFKALRMKDFWCLFVLERGTCMNLFPGQIDIKNLSFWEP